MMNTHDRHRLSFAIALTVVALPALWVSGRDQAATSGSPTAAVAGIDSPQAVGVAVTVTVYEPESPVFLGNGDGSQDAAQLVPVQQATPLPEQHADVRASYRHYRTALGCTTAQVRGGVKITITNLSNGQSVVCRNDLSVKLPAGVGILVNTELLAQIANIANAPIAVRITW
jgi:hypothetical protein